MVGTLYFVLSDPGDWARQPFADQDSPIRQGHERTGTFQEEGEQATGVMERAERANFVSKSDDKTPPDDMLALPLRLLREVPDFGDIAQLVELLVRNEVGTKLPQIRLSVLM
jgi:hypothetical protein